MNLHADVRECIISKSRRRNKKKFFGKKVHQMNASEANVSECLINSANATK